MTPISEFREGARVAWEVRSSYHTTRLRGQVTAVTPATIVVVEDRNKGAKIEAWLGRRPVEG